MAVHEDDVSNEESDEIEETAHVKKKHSIKSNVLDSFTQLSNGSVQTRVNGGLKLLGYLLSKTDTEEAEKEGAYAVSRLLRGIASSRATAREGYFITLTALLAASADMTVTSLLQRLNKELQIGGQSKSETGELCTGHVLVCGAVMRSGMFLRSSPEEQAALLTALMAAAGRKTYLGLLAYAFIVDFIKTHDEATVKESVWPTLKESLSRPLADHTLDSLLCLLAVADRCPSIMKKFAKKILDCPALICPETVATITDKLMNAPEFASVNHPVYEDFGRQIAKSEHLVLFWTSLEAKLSLWNQNRILIGLAILDSIFKNIGENANEIQNLISDKFVPCILEWFKGFKSANKSRLKKMKGKHGGKYDEEGNEGRHVVMTAKKVFDGLVQALKKEGVTTDTKVQVLRRLLFLPGDMMFSEITNTNITKLILDDIKFDGIKEFAGDLKKVLLGESKKQNAANGSERPWTNTEKLCAAEMLTHLICHLDAKEHVKWRLKNMYVLLQVGVFRSTGLEDGAPVSSELAAAVKSCFFRCLNCRFQKLETLLKLLTSLVDFIDSKLAVEKNLSRCFADQTLESWRSMRKFTDQLTQTKDTSKANAVFQILALHCGLFLFSDVMGNEVTRSSLKEVQDCYKHYINDQKSGGKNSKVQFSEGDIVDEEPEWIEVLVDVFLNFLSRDSFLLRSVVRCVFRLLYEHLTPSAMGQIISVLDPDNDTNPLSYRDDNSDEETPENENNSENEDDGKVEEDEESSGSDDDDDDDNGENTTVNDQLRMAVQKALGSAAPETDTESIDADNIGEEEGKRLDEALAGAFKMLKQAKGTKTKRDKKNEKLLMHFRTRVFDLVEIYLEKEPSMELCIGMLLPLLRCLEFSIQDAEQKPLENTVRKCLKQITSLKVFSSTEGVSMDVLVDNLKAITDRANRTQFVFQALGDVITKCGIFIVRCSQRIRQAETPSKKKRKLAANNPVVDIYKGHLKTFFSKRDCLIPVIFFHEVMRLNWEGNWEMLLSIVQHSFDSSIRQFRKNEGLEMINMFYKNLKRFLQTETAGDISKKLHPIEESLTENIVDNLKCNEENDRFFTVLLKLLVTIRAYHKSTNGSTDNMDWERIKPVVQSCRKQLFLRNCAEYHKFCNIFELEKYKNAPKNAKPQPTKKESSGTDDESNDDSDDDEASNEKKIKKITPHTNGMNGGDAEDRRLKRKNKNTEVSKKEAKQLRAQASSEGLGEVCFSNVLMSNIDVDAIGEDAGDSGDGKKTKKRKNSENGTEKKFKKKNKV